MKIAQLLVVLLMSATITACAQKEYYYGYSFPPDYEKNLHINRTSMTQVRSLLGSPTTESNFGEKTYYYIAQKQERVAFFMPKVEEQQVLALTFNQQGVLAKMQTYTLEQAHQIKFDEENTRLRGSESGALEQIFSNIGKFNPQTNQRPVED